MTMDAQLAEQHYAEHDGKPFFGELVDFITSGPLVAMVLEGDEAVAAARQVIGATNPLEATTGSIRGDFARRGRPEHGPRLGLARVRRARGGAVLPATSDPRVAPRRSGARSSSSPASRSRSRSPASRRSRRAIRAGSRRRTPAARRSRSRRAPATRSSSGADTAVALDGDILGKPADEAQAAGRSLRASPAHPRGRRRRSPSRRGGAAASRRRSSVTAVTSEASTGRPSSGT